MIFCNEAAIRKWDSCNPLILILDMDNNLSLLRQLIETHIH